LLAAIGLTPSGSSTAHIYTHSTQNNTTTWFSLLSLCSRTGSRSVYFCHFLFDL